MSRYIDADKTKKHFGDYFEKVGIARRYAESIVDNAIPTADVVEVVRCKNCKHHEELLNNNDGNVLCWVHGLDVIVDRNGYCNYGEREEQEHE